jgi:hypothetical protein
MRRQRQDDAEQLRFGDYVTYDLRASHGGEIEGDYVLGFMDYSHLGKQYKTDRNVVLLGGPKHIGMPINIGHCTIVSRGHDAECMEWRKRYEDRFPGKLFPLT